MAAPCFKSRRFIRTLKEQLLWLHRFRTIEELHEALRDFAKRFNNHWIIGRIGSRTPAAHRRILRGEAAWIPTSTCLRNWMRYTEAIARPHRCRHPTTLNRARVALDLRRPRHSARNDRRSATRA
jgi:hypothetical protein